jgi:uncharacterized integral membrane protein
VAWSLRRGSSSKNDGDPQNTAVQNTAVQNTAVQNPAVQNPAVQNTAVQNATVRQGRTRIGGTWLAVAVAVVLGVALIVFIVQNTRSVRVDFFSASGHIPVAVALLAAAVGGALVVLIVGVARTTQLRLSRRRERQQADSGPPQPVA